MEYTEQEYQEFVQSRLALNVFLQAVFNEAKVLDARDWRIFAGIARYFDQPQVPFGIKDVERAKRLGILTRYALVLQKREAAVADSTGEVGGLTFPQTLEEANKGAVKVYPAFLASRRADLVWDDAQELAACDFPYTAVATQLTQSTRQKVYGESLLRIKPPAEGAHTGGFFDTGLQFVATAATRATYDTEVDDQPYYRKWLAATPQNPKDRQYSFDKLSDEYLQLNYQAYDLEKGAVHLYLQIERISLIAKLYRDDNRLLAYDAIVDQGLPGYGNYFLIVADYIKFLKEQKRKVRGEAWFVHTLEGTDHPPKFARLEKTVTPGLTFNVLEEVVDPQVVVQSIRHLSFEQIDPIQKKWGRRDWLKEMVRLRFSEPWVWFWKNSYIEMFFSINRERLFLNDLRETARNAVGPLKQTLQNFIKKADADPNIYLVRRGSKYGDKRVIGSDESYIYFYSNKEKLVTRLPLFAFWLDVNVSQISQEIYENTRGMIPFAKVVVWGGVIVMGWAIVGTETLVNGARQYLKEKIAGLAMDKALKALWDKFKLRLFVLLIFPVLELFRIVPIGDDPEDGSTGGSEGSKIYSFIKGLFEGYSAHAFHALLDRWTSLINFEPASYRAVKMLMKIEAILRWVDEKMSALKGYVSEKVAKLLLNRLVSAVVKTGTGLIYVVNNLYFLDYDKAKGILALYAELSGEKMPTKADWDRLRHKHWLETFRYWEQTIKDEAIEIKDIYDDVQKYVRISRVVVKGAMGAVGLHVLSAGGILPMLIMALRASAKGAVSVAKSKTGKVAAAGLMTVALLDEDFRKEVLEFLSDFGDVIKEVPADIGEAAAYLATPAAFAWGTNERMARFGQLLGILVAWLVISKAVIKEKKWGERWMSTKGQSFRYPRFVAKHALQSQFNVNPLLPGIKLALFHYVQLIEKVIAESKQSFVDLEQRIEDILLGDPKFRDIIDPDEGLTLPKLLEILIEVNKLLVEWLKRLAQIPGLSERIGKIATTLEGYAPDKMPTFEQLRDGTLSEAEWVREAFMFVVLSHLHGALNWISEALQSLVTPVNPKDPEPVTVGFVLQALGLNLEADEAMEVLDRNFEDVFHEESA